MSQSVTVLSGANNGSISGLVTIPLDVQASIASSLQTLLTAESNSVASGSYYLNNVNAERLTTGFYTVAANNTTLPGILEFTNTDPNGSVVGGSSTTGSLYVISPPVPTGYNTFIDQNAGADFIKGSGATGQLDVFSKNASVTYNTEGGSGTIIAGGSDQSFAPSGSWTIYGSTDGGDTINANNGTNLFNTYGQGGANGNASTNSSGTPSNLIGLTGGNTTVNAGGTADLVNNYNGNVLVSVTGSAAVLDSGGNVTVDAAPGSTFVEAFFQVGGDLYFVNQSTIQAFVTGDAPGANGGQATIFGGAGGGVYYGGDGGANSLIGGFAPGDPNNTVLGAGLVTLIGGGSSNNFLEATGSVSGSGGNVLIAGGTGTVIGGSATLFGSSTTKNNTFEAGNASSLVVSTNGAGAQVFDMVVAQGINGGSEVVYGSTVPGASDTYYLSESDASGGGNTDIIHNFRLGTDLLTISGAGSTVTSVQSINGGTQFNLSDNTRIQLIGVTFNSSYNSTASGGYVGKSSI